MNNARTVILTGAYRYGRTHVSQPCNPAGRNRATAIQRRCAALDRLYGHVDYARWLERKPTGAERTALARELVQMEEQGLLVRLNGRGGSRTTHVVLTERGEAEALRILTDAVELLPFELPWKDEDEVPTQCGRQKERKREDEERVGKRRTDGR